MILNGFQNFHKQKLNNQKVNFERKPRKNKIFIITLFKICFFVG